MMAHHVDHPSQSAQQKISDKHSPSRGQSSKSLQKIHDIMSGAIPIQTELQSIKGKKKPQGSGALGLAKKDKKRHGVGEICIQE